MHPLETQRRGVHGSPENYKTVALTIRVLMRVVTTSVIVDFILFTDRRISCWITDDNDCVLRESPLPGTL